MLFRNLLLGSRTKVLAKSASPVNVYKQLTKRTICSTNVKSLRFDLNQKSMLMKTSPFTKTIPRSFSLSSKFSNPTTIAANATATTTPVVSEESLKTAKSVAYWLIGTSGLVFGIVILGGLTRLTESGLSITEWKPVAGTLPPLNQKQWEEEFEKYKESPEFKQLNSHINLDEFKFIFFMEWVHRLWGRAIGAVFILPAAYFAVSGKTSRHVNKRLLGLTGLLALQGFLGWWMVKSGLDQEQLTERNSKPTVSQYRLTTHLGAAFFLYMGMLWTGFEILRERKWIKDPAEALKLFKKLDNGSMGPLRKISLGLLFVSFVTAMSGGMVAGLDAGWIYNTWPKMGEQWLPPSRELMDDNFARREDKKDLWWRNLLENPTTVQLVHRTFAYTSFAAVLAAHMYCIKLKHIIPKNANTTMHALMGVVTFQVGLGIFTLLWLVPIPLASLHQGGALALVTTSLIFAVQLRKPRMPIRNLINSLYIQKLQPSSKILNEAAKFSNKAL
ncbi:Cox15p NDAI_0B03040 [Naumovozyma dairenensis CBS 421]|uniref:Cytochrome c oxidase assembly protein COX15 n=1 Tax=Naumovozyma dairenensis (strain ATCC 10597 / BCRC 20456 / CBS 421 / NBRC 0211 / NRRL Y-12639) TaxID=1071378 RepID=G0W6C8_NAUDC|nr:hypothetical protein NDAI_0B03040 [Naumovozyma dairenensis CBS 421]CCD23339.1 hypothetical protein NDAI_0B03040 [Naumovozyma dairenensis CBS 421]